MNSKLQVGDTITWAFHRKVIQGRVIALNEDCALGRFMYTNAKLTRRWVVYGVFSRYQDSESPLRSLRNWTLGHKPSKGWCELAGERLRHKESLARVIFERVHGWWRFTLDTGPNSQWLALSEAQAEVRRRNNILRKDQ